MKQYKILGNDPYHRFPAGTLVTVSEDALRWKGGQIIGAFKSADGLIQFVDVNDVEEVGV